MSVAHGIKNAFIPSLSLWTAIIMFDTTHLYLAKLFVVGTVLAVFWAISELNSMATYPQRWQDLTWKMVLAVSVIMMLVGMVMLLLIGGFVWAVN